MIVYAARYPLMIHCCLSLTLSSVKHTPRCQSQGTKSHVVIVILVYVIIHGSLCSKISAYDSLQFVLDALISQTHTPRCQSQGTKSHVVIVILVYIITRGSLCSKISAYDSLQFVLDTFISQTHTPRCQSKAQNRTCKQPFMNKLRISDHERQ